MLQTFPKSSHALITHDCATHGCEEPSIEIQTGIHQRPGVRVLGVEAAVRSVLVYQVRRDGTAGNSNHCMSHHRADMSRTERF